MLVSWKSQRSVCLKQNVITAFQRSQQCFKFKVIAKVTIFKVLTRPESKVEQSDHREKANVRSRLNVI